MREYRSVCLCLLFHPPPEVNFEDVIAEPASVRSFDRLWVWSHVLFECSRLWCYRLISLLLAVPVSLLAGLLLALLSCLHIWYTGAAITFESYSVYTGGLIRLGGICI